MNKKIGVIILSLILIISIATISMSFETKYYFSRNECRYIFKEGSCVVDDKHCNLNSYNYVKKILDPNKDCISNVTFNEGYTETDLEAYTNYPDFELVSNAGSSATCEFQVMEGDKVKIKVTAMDPDKEIGPAGQLIVTFDDPLNQNGEWQTTKGDAGVHDTGVEVSDGELTDSQKFCIEVLRKNLAPILSSVSDVTVKEGQTVSLDAKCTDDQDANPKITYRGFMTSDSKEIGFDDAGDHLVTIRCTDKDGEYDEKTVTVTVEDVNRPPKLDVSDVEAFAGDTVSIDYNVSDEDGDDVAVMIADPVGQDNEWKTDDSDVGQYEVKLTATDGKDKITGLSTITIKRVEYAPVLKNINDITVYEGDTVTITAEATDRNGDPVDVTFTGWMTSSKKTTGFEDAGVYDVTVTASDGEKQDQQKVKVTVLNKNRAPKITSIEMVSP